MEITANNVPDALYETICRMRVSAIEADSRNGPMQYIPEPVMITIREPTERVLFDPVRDANPFFHLAEAVWMLGGGQGLEFVQYYNSGMARYSDDGATLHGAYGHRWRKHFYRDQLLEVMDLLDEDPDTRRAYISMFDAEVDHGDRLDIPCNVGIALRVHLGQLDMTVFNRSNDLVWGALGANAVHMTILQEVLAHGIGRPVGRYRVVTNCLHGYTQVSQYNALLASTGAVDPYKHNGLATYPMLAPDEVAFDLLQACKKAVAMPWLPKYGARWLDKVWVPARDAYRARKENQLYRQHLGLIQANDWRLACTEWCDRREGNDNRN